MNVITTFSYKWYKIEKITFRAPFFLKEFKSLVKHLCVINGCGKLTDMEVILLSVMKNFTSYKKSFIPTLSLFDATLKGFALLEITPLTVSVNQILF